MIRPQSTSSFRGTQLARAIYSVCFLIGTSTHAFGIVQKGLLAFPVPLPVGIYWDALTLLDPAAAVLVWLRPRIGIPLAGAIMVTDVSVNTGCYLSGYFGPLVPNMVPLPLFLQALFAVFVLVTAPGLYRRAARP